jgi:hypothetical protein
VELQKKAGLADELKEQLDESVDLISVRRYSAAPHASCLLLRLRHASEKLRRVENVNEKLRKKLDETADIRRELKVRFK